MRMLQFLKLVSKMWCKLAVVLLLAVSSINSSELDSSEHGVRAGTVQTNCTCGQSNKSPKRIIAGEESDVNEWPMMVALILLNYGPIKNHFFCGGTIITERHIVTAGHCLHDDVGRRFGVADIGFILGAHNLTQVNYDDPAVVRKAENFVVHPNYRWQITYDLAIVVMPKITFSRIIGPACLPTGKFDITDKRIKVAGWGYTTPHGPPSDVLKKTDLIGMKHGDCGKFYAGMQGAVFEKNDPYQVCTSQPGTSACRGDSGGPLMWVDPDTNRYILVAAVSYGHPQCHLHPQVSSDISYFLPWIQKVLSETYPESKSCAKMG